MTIADALLLIALITNASAQAVSLHHNKPAKSSKGIGPGTRTPSKRFTAVARASPLLSPGSDGPGWWDSKFSASPVVLPPTSDDPLWRMWYYGRGDTWFQGVEPFLPTGRVGAATSEDGKRWRRVAGQLPEGACFDPSPNKDDFDSVQIGVGDVVKLPDGKLWMYYFGAGMEEVIGRKGLRMQIGLAESEDKGVSWKRLNSGKPVLEPGAAGSFDSVFVSWPRVLPPWKTELVPEIPAGKWYMSYHTAKFEDGAPRWSAGAAFSDDGVTWTKAPDPVLTGTAAGLWDSRGIGVRSVAVRNTDSMQDARLVMLYEAVDDAGDHAIGLAESADGISWERCVVPGAGALGGPVLAKGTDGDWDSKVIGTPYIVPPQGDEDVWRLYYLGMPTEKRETSIGVAECTQRGFTDQKWLKMGFTNGREKVQESLSQRAYHYHIVRAAREASAIVLVSIFASLGINLGWKRYFHRSSCANHEPLLVV